MPAQTRNKPLVRIPLRTILIVPFIIQITVVVGLVGYLSFRNGQRAVNNVAHRLRNEITARIEEHLQTFLDTPHQINQVNANLIRRGVIGANDSEALERHFWEQVQVFDSVTSIYFGNTEGGLVDAGREGAEGSLYVIVTDEFTKGPFRKYATDSEGNRTDLLVTVPDFDARTRPWYTGAVEKSDATWSDIYILFTGQDMAVAASRPVYDKQQNLLGVVSTDIFVSHLGGFLKSLEIGETGQSFIVERSGLLVASSADENPFVGLDKEQRRIHASESETPIIHYTAEFLTERFGDYHNIIDEQQFKFEVEGRDQFLQVSPVQDKYGIDWLVIVVIPEADFMAQIDANNRTTMVLIGIALVIAVIAGIVTTRWITKPILRLKTSAQALAKGEWQQANTVDRIDEIGELTLSFNNMAGQLKQMLENLTSEIAERKQVENALRESHKRFLTVLDSIDAHIYVADLETSEVLFVNKRMREDFGDNLIGEICWQVFRGESGPCTHCTNRELLAVDGKPTGVHVWEGQNPITERWYINYDRAIEWVDGRLVRLQIAIDITERKRVEEALRESEDRFRHTFEHLPIGVSMTLPAGEVQANGAFYRMLGYSQDRSALKWQEVTHPDDVELNQQIVDSILSGEEDSARFVKRYIHKDGSVVWADVSTTVRRDKQGRTKYFMTAINNITERMQMEDALREERDRAQKYLNIAGVMFVAINANGEVTLINRRGSEILGYEQADIVGKNWFDSFLPTGIKEQVRIVFDKLMAGETEPVEYFENPVMTQDGEERIIAWHNTILKDDEGNAIGTLSSGEDITKRKQAEEALRESEEKYRTLFEHLPIPVFTKNREGIYTSCNAENRKYWNVNPIGHTDAELLDPETAAALREADLCVMETGDTLTIEEHLTNTPLGERQVLSSKVPLHDGLGNIVGILGASIDITERVQAEDALRESEEKHRTLFVTMAQGVVYQDAEGQIISANPAAERILGLTLDQMQGRTSVDPRWKAIHEDGSDFPGETHPSMVALRTGKSVRDVVMGVWHPDKGEYRWINIDAVPQFKPGAATPYRVYTTFNDITERKRAEEALKESEEKYRLLFEHMASGFALHEMIYDERGEPADYRFLEVNPAFETLTGLKAEEILGKTVREIISDIEKEWIERYGKVALTGEPAEFEDYAEALGRYYEVRAFSPKRDQFATLFHDITDRKQAEEQIQASLREKEVLLREIHHRVKNNLMLVSSLLDFQSESIRDDRLRAAFENSQNRIRTMARVHEHLYRSDDLARVDMAEYIQNLGDYLHQSYRTYVLDFEIDVSDVTFDVDTAIPCGLIINELFSNALKHAFPKGQTGEIWISLNAEGSQCELIVRDNGIGLPQDLDPENIDSLGLRLVSLLIQQLKGVLELDRSEGTVFKIAFEAPELGQ